jgi:hypothetical protein
VTTWVGVDPGARWTGIVTRGPADALVHQAVVDRLEVDPGSTRVTFTYLEAVARAVLDARSAGGEGTPVAVEDVVSPIGYEFVRPSDLVGLGVVVGCLIGYFPDAVLVRPGKHGARPLSTYPVELTTPGERAHATRRRTWSRPAPRNSEIRHARSAWDVAGAGPVNQKIAAAVTAAAAKTTPKPRRPRARKTT